MLMTLFTLMTLVTDEFRDSLENLIDSLVIFSTANIFTVDLRDWVLVGYVFGQLAGPISS